MESGNPVMASAGGFPEWILRCPSCLGPSWCSQPGWAAIPLPCTRCSRIPSSQVSVFQCWRWALPSLGARKTEAGSFALGHTASRGWSSAAAAGQGAAASTPRCWSGQATRQYKPRHSRINWQYTVSEVFLHLFYYVVSDTAKSPVLKGYKITIRIRCKFISLNASLKKWKLEPKINKITR